MISRSAFKEWQENAVTQRVFNILKEDREILENTFLKAVPDYPGKENCLVSIGKLIGAINSIDCLLHIEYDQIEDEEEEEINE